MWQRIFCYFVSSFLVGFVVTIVGLWRYVEPLLRLVHLLIRVKLFGRKHGGKNYSIADFLESECDKNPMRVQIIMADTGEQRTIKEWDDLSNQFARFTQKQGSKQMDTLAVMMLNSVDFPCFWIGMTKIGCSSALVNTNLSGKPFLHSVETSLASSEYKLLLVDYDLVHKLQVDIENLLDKGIKVVVWKNDFVDGDEKENTGILKKIPIINKTVRSLSCERLDKSVRSHAKENDPAIFIFTSGTTGMPKACKISHTRFQMASFFYPILADLDEKDCLYCPLPLYHSAAGMIALGGCMRSGGRLLTRSKFSASNFSNDCVKYNVTAFQYIGELCRYLVTTPPNLNDSKMNLRIAFGNGMRKEYWIKFMERYNVKYIVEFYAATEGNVGLVNGTGQVGALGFIPRFLDFIYPLVLIKVDPDDNSKPWKDANGKYHLCKPNEPGLLLSRINVGSKDVTRRFDGYTDKKATNDKILRDVFTKGDAFFNTGDLLVRDSIGFFYWCDRTGDTFRWKGENCSTTEVSEVLSACKNVKDIVVYAVAVPDCDGKAGMAAIVTSNEDNTINLKEIIDETTKHLPSYARPLFVRIKKDRVLPTTSTHKYVKAGLVKEVSFIIVCYIFNQEVVITTISNTLQGFDPSAIGGDDVYYMNNKTNEYTKITSEVFNDIMTSKIRF